MEPKTGTPPAPPPAPPNELLLPRSSFYLLAKQTEENEVSVELYLWVDMYKSVKTSKDKDLEGLKLRGGISS